MIFLNSIIDVPDLVARLYLGLDGEKRQQKTPAIAGGGLETVPRVASRLRRFLDELYGIAKGLDGLGGVIGDLDAELFFEGHDQFDRVEAVGAQIVDERGVLGNLVLFHTQVLYNDLLHAVGDIAHVVIPHLVSGNMARIPPLPHFREAALGCAPPGGFSGLAHRMSAKRNTAPAPV